MFYPVLLVFLQKHLERAPWALSCRLSRSLGQQSSALQRWVEQGHLFHFVAFADVLAQPLVATAPFPVPSLGAVAFALAHEIRMGVNVIFAPSDVDPPSTKV